MSNAFEKSMNIAPVMLPSFNDCQIDSVRYNTAEVVDLFDRKPN